MKGHLVAGRVARNNRILLAAAVAALGCSETASAPSGPAAPPPVPESASPPEYGPPKQPRTPIDGRSFPDKVVALTWDDGPDANTLELAEYLSSEHVAATFFVVDEWVAGISNEPGDGNRVFATGYSDIPILGDLVALGHRLGNHTLNHVVLSGAPASLIDRELRDNQTHIDPFLINELRLFRAPGGGWNTDAAAVVDGDPILSTLIGPVGWDVDRKDWENSLYCRSSRPSAECERAAPGSRMRVEPAVTAHRYVSAIEAAGHGIVLFHDRVGHVGSNYALEVAQATIGQLRARGFVFVAPVLRFSPLLRRTTAPHTESFRIGDVNGDGRGDVCARGPLGVSCATSTSVARSVSDHLPMTTFGRPKPWDAGMTDRNGWFLPEHAKTVDLADVDGDGYADLCGRAPDGIVCALAAPIAGKFEMLQWWSQAHRLLAEEAGDFSDADGWGSDEGYYGTVRFADLDGDGRADVCGRAPTGVVCARSKGSSFERARSWLSEMTDGEGWLAPEYSATIQLADVNGDGRADVCGRGKEGILCALSTGSAFGRLHKWSAGADFSDADARPWAKDPGYFTTIRFGDLNGDGRADVCGRSAEGVFCALSTGHALTKATNWLPAGMTDKDGWLPVEYSETIQLGDINGDGRADLCGHDADGIVCALAP